MIVCVLFVFGALIGELKANKNSVFIYLFSEYAGILLQLKVRVSVKKPQPRKINSRRASCEDQVKLNSKYIFFSHYFSFFVFTISTLRLLNCAMKTGSTDKYSKFFKWNQKPWTWMWCTCKYCDKKPGNRCAKKKTKESKKLCRWETGSCKTWSHVSSCIPFLLLTV